ncbi:MAG: molybdopterin molybdotransferase MoeA [Actinobacteria bacterium]|nr:molybdopterin molybdotransferase MoeA [Actinomycetota bacterium]
MPLVPLEQVRDEILRAVSVLEPIEVPLADAHGLVLAEAVSTSEDVPPFANTAMDGYAVRACDTSGASTDAPVSLKVVGELPAGRAPDRVVGPGEAIRIMTGAPIPEGADAIVMVERTRIEEGVGSAVLVEVEAKPGDHVRPAGGDLTQGQQVFPAGAVLSGAHLGVLASVGASTVQVHPRPKVGVLSTGDELVEAGPPGSSAPSLGPGQIRDSNRPMLLAIARESGFEPIDLGVARDDEASIVATLEDAFARCDAVLTSGGVSVGDYDYVKAALERLGRLEWRQVAIKPAKPLAFGVVSDTPVFGLPGNPVSSLVSFELFARPAILKLAGHEHTLRPEVTARAAHDFARKPDGKVHLDRVHVQWERDSYVATSTGRQESNVLSATASANGFALIPDGDGIREGESVQVMLLS